VELRSGRFDYCGRDEGGKFLCVERDGIIFAVADKVWRPVRTARGTLMVRVGAGGLLLAAEPASFVEVIRILLVTPDVGA
jgi:hypothetical protein